jgi:hypothetical protein
MRSSMPRLRSVTPVPAADTPARGSTARRPSLFDHAKAAPPIDPREIARMVARTTGKSLLAQRREIIELNLAIGMITADEYYYYRLYDDRTFSRSDKRRFLGLRAQSWILRQCTDRTWWGVVHDKLIFQSVLQAYGVAMPRLVATYHPTRGFPGATELRTATELARFFREGTGYPVFGKPFDGMFSVGSARFDSYDAATDCLSLHTGAASVDDVVNELARYMRRGYLLQEVKHPDPRLHAVCGDRLGCLRVVVLLGPDGPEIFRALWKVPTGSHVADNFWRTGNMLAAIDIATGRITRVVTGVGPDQREVDRHPDSGAMILGTVFPQWERVKTVCLTTATALPGLAMQAWDVAVCTDGPVVIEANVGGDFNLPQLAMGAGLLDERFERFLRERGYTRRWKPLQAAYALAPRSVAVVSRLARTARSR